MASNIDKQRGHHAWKTVCAKLGHSNASFYSAGGTVAEAHEGRKLVRRAMNDLSDQMKAKVDRGEAYSEEEITALDFASNLVREFTGIIELMEVASTPSSKESLQNRVRGTGRA